MNIFYKIFIMIFLNGAGTALSQVVLYREISYQTMPGIIAMAASAAGWLAGILLGYYLLNSRQIEKATPAKLEILFGMSMVALAFLTPALMFAVRYFKPVMKLAADTPAPYWAQWLPANNCVFTGLINGNGGFFSGA